MKRTKKAIVLGLVATASALAGCGGPPEESADAVADTVPYGEPEPSSTPTPREARKKGERGGRDD